MLNLYSSISGYKINLDKIEILPRLDLSVTPLNQIFPLNGLKYLGILVHYVLNNL